LPFYFIAYVISLGINAVIEREKAIKYEDN